MTATLRAMAIGDSFVVPRDRRRHVHTSAERVGIRVATRAIDDDNVRIWKVGVDEHELKLAERREQSSKQPVPYKQPPPPRTPTQPVAEPRQTKVIEPDAAVSMCAAAGVKITRFIPELREWKIRGVTEEDLRSALASGAKTLGALNEIFKGAH